MKNALLVVCALGIWTSIQFSDPAMASAAASKSDHCALDKIATLPARPTKARAGSGFVQEVRHLVGAARDAAVTAQVMSGNVPDFLRTLVPVTLSGTGPKGQRIEIQICVTPDYLAVGHSADFVRVPVGLPAAARIAAGLGLMLPTTKMVDAIYAQAEVRVPPAPMPPTDQMASTEYFWRHQATVENQLDHVGTVSTALTAGQKKDIVLSNRLRSKSGRVAIYGWHRANGKPIQPLSTVHGASYADYSHGVRLVGSTAFLNGVPYPLAEILEDPQLSPIVSDEGPVINPQGLLVSLR